MSKQYKFETKECVVYTTADSRDEAKQIVQILLGKNVK